MKKNMLVIVISVILGLAIGIIIIQKDNTVPEGTKSESEHNGILNEDSIVGSTDDLDIRRINNKKAKMKERAELDSTAISNKERHEENDKNIVSAETDSAELYKELVIESPYTLKEDTTFSLTWNSDGSPEYDTIGATVYKYDYSKYKTIGRCDLIVNGKAYEASTDAGEISGIYVADLNVNDDMRNILILENQESWNYLLHIYAYKGTELIKIGKVFGEPSFESITGDGSFATYYRRTWRAGDNGFIAFKYLHNVDGSNYVLVQEQAGSLGSVDGGFDKYFSRGYTVKLNKDVAYYSDAECTQYAGTLEAGELVEITGQAGGKLRINYGDNEGWAIFRNYGPEDSDNDLEGYYYFY